MRSQFHEVRKYAGMILPLCLALLLVACGDSGNDEGGAAPPAGLSSQVVSGVASAGAPLDGMVTLKDASAQERASVISSDGSFAIDVSNMTKPFVLRAEGSAGGRQQTLYSFADDVGTANINPLSNAAVAGAAGVDDPAQVFDSPDTATLDRVQSHLEDAVVSLLTELQPALDQFDCGADDPIKGHIESDHNRLDGFFDNTIFTLSDGDLTVHNAVTGAMIYSGRVTDVERGEFSENEDDLPSPPSLPDAPQEVTATGGAAQVTITWEDVCNATSYNLYWSTTPGVTPANGTQITGVMSPYDHTGLQASTTYYYVVTAVNGAGEGPASEEASATTTSGAPPPPTVPAAPTGVTATGGTNQVSVFWQAVSGATSYNLYWSTTSGVTPATGTEIAGAMSPAVLTNLTANTTYYVVVTAVNSAGESTPSVQAAATTLPPTPPPTAPPAPTGVTATGGASQATVSWSPSAGATSYNLYWSTTAGVTTATGTRIAGVTSPYVQTGLSAGTTYYYVVTAANGAGESPASAEASATTNAPPPAVPPAPTGVTAVGGANQVTVSWPAVAGATSYNLYWSVTSGVTVGTGTRIAGATSPYLQTGLAAGSTYYYVVTAVNAAGEGPASAQVSATTNAPPPVLPPAPTGVTAVGGTDQVTISWSATPGATSYNLYWSTTSGVTPATGTQITGITSPYVQTGLTGGTTYYYVVTAVNAAGEGPASAQVSATATTGLDGAALYATYCAGCHGPLATSSKRGRTAAQIQTAIANVGAMSSLSSLTTAQIDAIATALQ